jgi:acylglycerol lipase
LDPSQDTCRDPAVQKEYANDPLCKQVGTYRGVADMLLGVRFSLLSLSR